MENASKALIIAGAILLSILIISLGIIIYRQAAGIVNNNAMDEFDATTFNTKWTQYTGTSVRATVVRSLFDQLVASNAANVEHKVEIYNATYNKSSGTITKGATQMTTQDVRSDKLYHVSVDYNSDNGYVNKIYVAPMNS